MGKSIGVEEDRVRASSVGQFWQTCLLSNSLDGLMFS